MLSAYMSFFLFTKSKSPVIVINRLIAITFTLAQSDHIKRPNLTKPGHNKQNRHQSIVFLIK